MTNLDTDVMFQPGNCEGFTDREICLLNAELETLLADLAPGGQAYQNRAKAFREDILYR